MVTGGGPVATWTVLFTDIVGSTEWRVRVGEEAFDLVRADVGRRIARVMGEHEGTVVKSLGDGVMVGFVSTAAALRSAVALQQSVAARNRDAAEPLSLRVGLSVGDAIAENGDLHGTAVVEAARLCAAADGGSILCSEAVRIVSANRSGCSFGEGRSLELKGMASRIVVHEVLGETTLAAGGPGGGLAFRVLGQLAVDGPGGPIALGGPKERVVLALLVAQANTTVSVDSLVESMWGDRAPRTAERTVHAYVARLRRALEPDRPDGSASTLLVTVGRGYRLCLAADQLDSTRFDALATSGTAQRRAGHAAAAATLRSALAMWHGEPYAEFPEALPCALEAARLTELHQSAVEERIEADLAAGQSAELVSELEGLVRSHPFRERLWGQLIVALYRSGRQREALDAYQRARRLLADELGIEPGPELRRLEAAVLAQDPSLDYAQPRAERPAGFPLALEAVGPAFLGREHELDWLRSAWTRAAGGQGGFVSVLGPEGMGKTRLVAELAREVYASGAAVLYGRCDHAHRGARALLDQALGSAGASLAGTGGDAAAADLAEAVTRDLPVWSGGRPVLLVLDDLHVADADTLEVVADIASWCRASSMLVVGAFRSDGEDPARDNALQLVLRPLGAEAVADICQLYEPDAWTVEDVRHVSEVTNGVPLLIHEQASAWARERTSRRVEDASERLAATRGRLLTSRGELADGIEGIQRLLEQRRSQLAGREAQHQASVVSALAACPYKGLARFEQADAANFFGRERLVAELVARLAETSLLAVVGPSGSGKSSLMRAGLLPALASGLLPGTEPWRTVTLCPGSHPNQELAARLGAAGHRGDAPMVVFVDQFEETFNLGATASEQREFVERLVDLSREQRCSVVLAVRADHLGRCVAHPALAEALTGNDVLVGPMRDTELRRTVVLPAERAGLAVGPGLVDLIVADVAGRAGALPLLSTALAETWERREDRTLTVAGYRAAGGVNGALARLAEDAYQALPAGSAPAAKRILLRLCDTGEAGLDLRRRLPIDETVDPDDALGRAALEVLSDRRLVTLDDDSVEVAHEALLREWPRLRGWLEEDQQGRQLHRRLGAAARAWDESGHDPSELYRGTRLGAATDWAAQQDASLNRTERAFLAASQDEATRELDEAERRATDGLRTNRRLRRLVSGIGIALVLALLAGGVALIQNASAAREQNRASQATAEAEARANEVILQGLRSQAGLLRSTRRDLGALLAVAAYRIAPEAESLGALVSVFTGAPSLMSTTPVGVDSLYFAVFLPDRATVAMADFRLAVTLVDATTGEIKMTLPAILAEDGFGQLAPSADGRYLAVASQGEGPGHLTVWDLSTGERRFGDVPMGDLVVGSLAYSPDGSLIAVSGGEAGLTEIHSAVDGRLVRSVPNLARPANAQLHVNTAALAFLPDGRLAIGSQQGPVRLVDPETGVEVGRLPGPVESASAFLTVSPDGGRLFGFSVLGAAAWDLRLGTLLWATTDIPACEYLVVADPRNALLCPLADGRVASFNQDNGALLDPAFDHQTGALAMAVSPDGATLLEASGASITRWRLDGGGAASQVLPGSAGWVPQEFDAGGRLLVVKPAEGGPPVSDLQLIDAGTGAVIDPLDGVVAATTTATPDQLGVMRADGTAGRYDTARHAPVAGPPSPLTFEPIGARRTSDRLVVWSSDQIQGLADGVPVDPAVRIPGGLETVVVSADGSRLFTIESSAPFSCCLAGALVQRDGSGEVTGLAPLPGIRDAVTTADVVVVATSTGRLQVLDATTLEPSGREFPGAGANTSLQLSNDGTRLLVVGPDRTLQLADLASRSFLGDPIDVVQSGGGLGEPPGDANGVLSDDGEHLAYSSATGIVVWDLAPERLVAAACAVAGRNLTAAEWDEYIGPVVAFEQLCPG